MIKQLTIGKGDDADAARLALAIASNIGSKPMTRDDRIRIAKYLYGERECTQEQIATQLGVSQNTISLDLSSLSIIDKPKRPKGGRPKGKR